MMVLQRFFFSINKGCIAEAIAEIQAEILRSKMNARVLRPVFAPLDQLLFEIRFGSNDEAKEFWDMWEETGKGTAFRVKFDPLYHGEKRFDAWQIHPSAEIQPPQGRYDNWRITGVKPGHDMDIPALLGNARAEWNRFHILSSAQETADAVAIVFEFDNVDAYLQEWREWVSQQSTPAFWEAWNRGTGESIENSVWEVA